MPLGSGLRFGLVATLFLGTPAAQAQPAPDAAASAAYLRQVMRITFDFCPLLLAKPAGASDLTMAQQMGVTGEPTAFGLLRTPSSDAGEIAFGTQYAVGVQPDGKSSDGNACFVAASSPLSTQIRAAVIERLKSDGFVFDRETLIGSVFKRRIQDHWQTVDVVPNPDGSDFEFVTNPRRPVVYFIFTN
jgi:hypothetical protein